MQASNQQRFIALDVFRGMTICFMIIVNTPGSGQFSYAPLNHAVWHGFTPTDLVFPSFLFAVGNAMSFVMVKWANLAQSQVLWKIFKRTWLIFLLGYLLYWFPFIELDKAGNVVMAPISHTRILGVLQRIALAYGIGSLMIYYLKPKASVIICMIILIIYWPIMYYFGDPADPLSLTGNAGLRLDKWLMGENHMYHGEGIAFDPEGWISTLPAEGNVIGGYVVGQFIQQKGKTYETIARLMLAGFGLLVIAYFWDLGFPINKKLWTSSFVLCTLGIDLLILPILIFFIDIKNEKRWTYFFEVLGKNTLFVYLLSEIGIVFFYVVSIGDQNLYTWLYQNVFRLAGDYVGSLLFAVSWMLVCWSVGYWMDKKKIYVKV